MKNLKLSFLITLILTALITSSCQEKQEQQMPESTPIFELESVIEQELDSFYIAYRRSDGSWIDFFEDEFTNVFPDTPIRKISKDSTRSIWKNIYDNYDVQLISRGKPSFITSEDMVISHNQFEEVFIDKESNDTIWNAGSYTVAWRRQADNSWKIVFESVQNNEL